MVVGALLVDPQVEVVVVVAAVGVLLVVPLELEEGVGEGVGVEHQVDPQQGEVGPILAQ